MTQESSKKETDERLDTWVAGRERLSEELQSLAESNEHLAAVMDELEDEEKALEDRAFSLFKRSMSLDAADATNSYENNLIGEAPDVNGRSNNQRLSQ